MTWLAHLHPVLVRQQLDYRVIVAEQGDPWPFNRGAIMNAAFLEARKLDNFTCYVFHDVDMVPETDLALYRCPASSREVLHLAVAVSRWRYRLTYPSYLGGIVLMSPETFINIGGFSNSFWGWGGEDDDLYCRLERNNITIRRYLVQLKYTKRWRVCEALCHHVIQKYSSTDSQCLSSNLKN